MPRLNFSEPRRSLVGLHSSAAADAARSIISAAKRLPERISSALLARNGVGATQPSATRTVSKLSSLPRVRRTQTPTHGLSTTELLEKRIYSTPARGGSGGTITCVRISSSPRLV